jgi:hypothetical protein
MMAIKESIVVPGGAKRLNGETKNVKGGFDTTIPNTKCMYEMQKKSYCPRENYDLSLLKVS